MNKKINKIVIKFLIIITVNIFLLKYVGNLYLKKFNLYINDNNELIIKNKINNIIRNNVVSDSKDLYEITFNANKEIIGVNMDINQTNIFLSNYIKKVDKELNYQDNNYLDNYYKKIIINRKKYYLLPLGMISNNPFIYNTGPKIIVSYDYINVPSLKIKVTVKNYGLNNALIETFLIISIDQNITKPVLYKFSTISYQFLISSKIVNGRVPSYLGTNLCVESDGITNN